MTSPLLGVIPYKTMPTVDVGPFQLQTFGLMAAIGIIVGGSIAARYAARRTEVPTSAVYLAAARLVLAGVVGARLSFVLTNLETMHSVGDAFAIREGGMQFSGGFLGAIIAGSFAFRGWSRTDKWVVVDGLALGLATGLIFGRIGCFAMGEHFGRPGTGLLAVRYEGGPLREITLGGPEVLMGGETFHHMALYEGLVLVVLAALLAVIGRRRPAPGTLMAVYCMVYGAARFAMDFFRVNDEHVGGLTGAQYLMIGIAAGSIWLWARVIPRMRSEVAEPVVEAPGGGDASQVVVDGSPSPVPA